MWITISGLSHTQAPKFCWFLRSGSDQRLLTKHLGGRDRLPKQEKPTVCRGGCALPRLEECWDNRTCRPSTKIDSSTRKSPQIWGSKQVLATSPSPAMQISAHPRDDASLGHQLPRHDDRCVLSKRKHWPASLPVDWPGSELFARHLAFPKVTNKVPELFEAHQSEECPVKHATWEAL